MTVWFLVLGWVVIAMSIVMIVVQWFIVDRFVKLLDRINTLATFFVPVANQGTSEKPAAGPTSVTINDPLEWREIDERGNEVVPRD